MSGFVLGQEPTERFESVPAQEAVVVVEASEVIVTAGAMSFDGPDEALAKENLTEKVIAELEARYTGLAVDGITDKVGLLVVKNARKHCKALRVLAGKVCKAGREDARKVVQGWVDKEKDVSARIAAVEAPLQEEENRIATLLEEERRVKAEAVARKIAERIALAATYGKVFPFEIARDMADKAFGQYIECIRMEFETAEAERVEAERVKNEEAAELLRLTEERELKAAAAREEEALLRDEERKALEDEKARVRVARAAVDKLAAELSAKSAEPLTDDTNLKTQDLPEPALRDVPAPGPSRPQPRPVDGEPPAQSIERANDKVRMRAAAERLRTMPWEAMESDAGKTVEADVKSLIGKIISHLIEKAGAL